MSFEVGVVGFKFKHVWGLLFTLNIYPIMQYVEISSLYLAWSIVSLVIADSDSSNTLLQLNGSTSVNGLHKTFSVIQII